MSRLKFAEDLTLRADEAVTQKLKNRLIAGSPVDGRGCWLWKLSTKNGYGQISIDGRMVYTHRLAYVLFIGPIPAGKNICHSCDVSRCNNPQHFFLGTQADNLQDMRQKGRGSRPPHPKGEQHHEARLTDKQVVEIRAAAEGGERQRSIAARFGCSQATVSTIVRGVFRKEAK